MNKIFLFISTLLVAMPLMAEHPPHDTVGQAIEENFVLVGSIQHDGLYGFVDKAIGADKPSFPYQSNTYLDIGFRSKYVSAGVRGELMLEPLPGYEATFRGAGVSNLYVKFQNKYGSLTLGDVYGQFGSGLILRLYEERAIGFDNSVRGAKLVLTPYKGISFTALGGKQRRYWQMYDDGAWGFNYKQDALIGADLELDIHEWIPKMQEAGANLTLGASWVSKYQQEDTVIASEEIIDGYLYSKRYNLPKWVGAYDVRAQFQMKGWNALVEYAYKANDPSYDNHFSYHPGHIILASLSYSRSGLAVLAQVKRSENFSFRSQRLGSGIEGQINHLPPFAEQHTYTLPAFNIYATQTATGEWAFQGQVAYTWKRNTAIGGKYGTTFKLNGTHIRGLEGDEPYYTDINIEFHKRVHRNWTVNAMLMYQAYNQFVCEGHGPVIRSGIAVADVKWVVNSNIQMRAELQYLFSKEDKGQWLFALYELSLYKKLMLTASNNSNLGGTDIASRQNYWSVMAVVTHKSHRLSVGYERAVSGYNCAGGVCRYVPAHKGVVLSYNFTW